MPNYSYFNIIRHTHIQLLDLFNEIQVRRYDKSGNVIQTIGKVPLRFGPKSKIWAWINQNNFDRVLPVISVFFTGITIDTARLAGIHSRTVADPNYPSGIFTQIGRPTPFDLSYKVTIWAKYIEDLNQILENVLPYFTPFLYITIKEPITENLLNFRVELEDVATESNEEFEVEDRRIISWDITIRVKAWLFKYIDDGGGKLIRKVLVHWWGRDATTVQIDATTIDGTIYTTYGTAIGDSPKPSKSFEDIALTVTEGLDYDGGVIDWEYSIYEPGSEYEGG